MLQSDGTLGRTQLHPFPLPWSLRVSLETLNSWLPGECGGVLMGRVGFVLQFGKTRGLLPAKYTLIHQRMVSHNTTGNNKALFHRSTKRSANTSSKIRPCSGRKSPGNQAAYSVGILFFVLRSSPFPFQSRASSPFLIQQAGRITRLSCYIRC